MSRFPLSLVWLGMPMMAAAAAMPARAFDVACERVVAASEKKLAAPAFHDRKEISGLVHELLLADGKLYQRDTLAGRAAEPWAASPITLADIRAAASTYRKNLQACRRTGADAVDGVPTEAYEFAVKEGTTLINGKVWIGVADGLPYREEATGLKGTTVYRNVKAPR